MKRVIGPAALLFGVVLGTPLAHGADSLPFWDLNPEQLRTLIAAPQVMVTRTPTGLDAYCRCPVVLKPHEIPEVMKKAIIAVEDKRFLDHGGLDLIALGSVLRGGLGRGGSTIPMQLLKNLVLHDLQGRDVLTKLERKGAEIWHAGKFDGAVGKQELLAAYLNQIEFGGREVVGLYRAARHYFRKEPTGLNLYESALLAGMVQAPARFNPLKESTKQRAHERARLVLSLMVQQGRITKAEEQKAIQVGVRPGQLPEFRIQTQAFTEWVVQSSAAQVLKEGETLRFFVTLEPRFQRIAEGHLRGLLNKGAVPVHYETGLVMMRGDGRVQAMVGGADWSKRQFNNVVKSNVQPGSTAKLPLLIAACEAGKKPESRVLDLPLSGEWPSNGQLGYKGETTLKEAFASSRNAAAVQLAQELGIQKVADVSRRLGIEPGPKPDLSFVLGSFSTNLMNMTSAYTAVANGGYRITPHGVLAVVDGRGQVRESFFAPGRTRVIPEKCIQPTRSILNEVVRSGTGRGAGLQRWSAYGKTGTSTGNADAWFIGWSEGRIVGIWMGKRRDETNGVLAGAGAPADLFRRVATSTNEMVEYRAARERQGTKPPVVADSLPAPRGDQVKPKVAPAHKLAAVKPAAPLFPAPATRRCAPQLLPSPSWDEEFWPEEEEDLPPGWW